MHCVSNILSTLQFAYLVAAALYFGEYELPEMYDVVLKDDASMSTVDHSQWAEKIHMDHQHNEGDEMFGLVQMEDLDAKSYGFCTYDDTIDIIRQHPDVLQAEKRPLLERNPHKYIVTMREGVSGAAANAEWANSVHLLEQADNPDDKYTGVDQNQILTNGRWCYTGTFSSETVETIKQHPDVESVENFFGGLWA